MTTTLWFGSTLWLATIGLVASLALPLAGWLERRYAQVAEADSAVGTPEPIPSRRVRPLVVVNAVAAGLLVVSVVAASADPLPVRLSTALPTYLGLRERAQDSRAKENLLEALDAFDAYRSAGGSPAAFDAAAGAAGDASLLWEDGLVPDAALAVSVVSSTPRLVRLATVSASGAALCAQATRAELWRPTYGSGAAHGSEGTARALREAIASCGAEPFSRADVPRLPVVTLCDGVDRDGIILCRAVQRLVSDVLASSKHPAL